jgi:hypothetical protein
MYVIHPSSYFMSLFNELCNKVVPTSPEIFCCGTIQATLVRRLTCEFSVTLVRIKKKSKIGWQMSVKYSRTWWYVY